jgi:hypothetical protein
MLTPGFRPMAPWLALVYSKANLFLKQIIREAKMEAGDIERYLAELGAELTNRGLKKPVRVLLIGGAYMLLLANASRSTKDIDIFWLTKMDCNELMLRSVRAFRLSNINMTSMLTG